MDDFPSQRASAAKPLVTWSIFSIREGVTLNWLLKKMQLATDSGVLKTDPHKSQSFNHFHVPHSPQKATSNVQTRHFP